MLGQIFGSRDVSRTVAQNASAQAGLDPGVLKKMLPMLAMLVTGYLATERGAGSAAAAASGGGLGGMLGGLLGSGAGSGASGFGTLTSMLDMRLLTGDADRLIVVDDEFVVRGELPQAMGRGRVMRMTALPVFLKTYIDRLTFSFTDYLRQEPDSSTELHQWIRRNYVSFRDLELNAIA